jgi:hypothetical protein
METGLSFILNIVKRTRDGKKKVIESLKRSEKTVLKSLVNIFLIGP